MPRSLPIAADWPLRQAGDEGIGLLNRYFVGRQCDRDTRAEPSKACCSSMRCIYAAGTGNRWLDNLGPQCVSLDQQKGCSSST